MNRRGGRPLTKYRMYVDEVGNADLRSSDDPNHRFFSLTGVVLELGHVESVSSTGAACAATSLRSHAEAKKTGASRSRIPG